MNRFRLTDSKHSLDVDSPKYDHTGMIAQHFQLYIERTDSSKNMARFYALSIDPDLFGEARLTRRWGRIGTRGQHKIHQFKAERDAVALFLDLLRQKRARGYLIVTRTARTDG